MEPYLDHGPPRSPRRTWWNSGGTLVEPLWNLPQTTPGHPAPLAEIGGTLVWWNPGGTLVKPWWNPPRSPRTTWWNPGGTARNPPGTLTQNTTPRPSQNLVEPWWNPSGTLVEPYLRAAPDHPGAYLGLRPQSFQLLRKKTCQWLSVAVSGRQL